MPYLKRISTLLLICFWFISSSFGQQKAERQKIKDRKPSVDSTGRPIKTGWNFGVVPVLSIDADKGFTYGIAGNLFDYYDGRYYPDYRHSIYAEVSYSTKKVGTARLFFESNDVIKNHKLLLDFSYLPDALNNFYGFNGSQSIYHYEWENSGDKQYITKYFYKRRSDLFRVAGDLRGNIAKNFYWYGGLGVLGFKEGRTRFAAEGELSKEKELFELYKDWGIISKTEAEGGWHPYIRGGVGYDTRTQKYNSPTGICCYVYMTYNSAFGDMKGYNNLKINFDFMHFVPIVGNRLVFAYHVATQNTIGKSPYYLDSYLNVLYIDRNRYYAIGGVSSVRGMLRNRVWGPGFAFANLELRSRIVSFDLWNQHFYFGMIGFIDAGMITQVYDIDQGLMRKNIGNELNNASSWIGKRYAGKTIDDVVNDFFDFNKSPYIPHFGGGLGLKLAMNENFVLSVEWALPFDKQDNPSIYNFYIGAGYMF